MLTLIQYNLPILLVAVAIGVATGWWAFRRPRPTATDSTDRPSEDPAAS